VENIQLLGEASCTKQGVGSRRSTDRPISNWQIALGYVPEKKRKQIELGCCFIDRRAGSVAPKSNASRNSRIQGNRRCGAGRRFSRWVLYPI